MSNEIPIQGSIFQFLAKIFKKHDVSILLVGGYALNAYKVQRMTFDIDFITTKDGYNRIENELALAGYELFNQSDAFVQLRGTQPGFRDLDFLLSDEITISRLIENGTAIQIAGEDFIVPAPIHLIAMKLHSISSNKQREIKDFQDIVQLMRSCEIDPTSDEIISLFKKYNLNL
jgi:D-arabinose 1-dehydrogenase-like Zn-dependent alcohol dehydrogenase